MSNPTFKPSEGKREEFRKYLEKNGVMDALTKVLVNLYEEIDKPTDALGYIIDKLAGQAGLETHAQLKVKQDELQAKIDELQAELDELKVSQAPPTEEQPVEGGAEIPPGEAEPAAPEEAAPEPENPPEQ